MPRTDSDGRTYGERISAMVGGIAEEASDFPESDFQQIVNQTIDSSRLVTQKSEALFALESSDHRPEEWKHLVSEGDTHGQVITAMAYDVVRQDVWIEIKERGLDDE